MKTLGRILIILAAFAIVMGITYVVLNATRSATTVLTFDRGVEGFAPPDGVQTPFPNGERPDFDGAYPGGGWIFGLVKNVGILAILVTLIALPKSLMRRKARLVQIK